MRSSTDWLRRSSRYQRCSTVVLLEAITRVYKNSDPGFTGLVTWSQRQPLVDRRRQRCASAIVTTAGAVVAGARRARLSRAGARRSRATGLPPPGAADLMSCAIELSLSRDSVV